MLGGALDAASAGYRVGYDDASHFSREYKRLFGACPSSLWMLSAAGTPLGTLANVVAENVPWAVKVAKEVLNRRRDETHTQPKEA